MKKNGNKSSTSRIQYNYETKKNNNISSKQQNEFKDYDIDSDFFDDFNPDFPGTNIHQKNLYSSNDQSSKINREKIFKEKEESISRSNHATKISNQTKNENNNRTSKYSNLKNEASKQRTIYKSPDHKGISPSISPISGKYGKESKDFEEIGYKTNYVYESKKVNGKNLGTYSTNEKYEYVNRNGRKESKYEKSIFGSPGGTEVISPVGYIDNNSSGSEFEENQKKTFDNIRYSSITNKTTKSYIGKNNKNEKTGKNYEIEDPERFNYLSKNQRKTSNDESKKTGYYNNRSQIRNKISDLSKSDIKDFQSPDRDRNDTDKFRKVNIGMLLSKEPYKDNGKVTKTMTKEVIKTSTNYNEGTKYINKRIINNYYSQDQKKRINAAKIIQFWWRNLFYREEEGEEEIYDIANQRAVKIQSWIRGCLVRKKVLRYIALTVFYQSFCDKLQDIFSNKMKKEIFKLLKEKYYLNKNQKKRILNDISTKRKKILNNIIQKIMSKSIIIKKWKQLAIKLKNRSINKKINNKYNSKTVIAKNNVKQNNKTISKNNYQNVNRSENMYFKEVNETKTKIIKQEYTKKFTSTKTNLTETKTKNKTYNLTKSKSAEKFQKNNEYQKTSRIPTVRIEFKGVSTPYKYSPDISKDDKKESFYPNSYRGYFAEKKENNINVNKSFTNSYYQKEKELVNYTSASNEKMHHKCFNRIEKSKEKSNEKRKIIESERNISPQFGCLRNKKEIKQLTNIKFVDKRKNKPKENIAIKNINNTTTYNKSANKLATNKKDTKTTTNINIVKNTEKKDSAISQKKINYSESENIYTHRKDRKNLCENRYSSDFDNIPNNTIDNQLSISIVKLPEVNKSKNSEKSVEPSKIKIKEKIIIQKEMQPETAEEGNNFQIFDMKISKRVSLFIKPTTELKRKIIDEQKELEIIKKIEREKNKEIDKYKKDIEMHKKKNKLDALKHAIKTVEIFKENILRKKFNQYKKIVFTKSVVLEIESHDDIQIDRVKKETEDFQVQITPPPKPKETKIFKKLIISNIKPVFYLYKKVEKPQQITNTSKFNILSKVKKISIGQQSDPWKTQVTRLLDNNLSLIHSKPKMCESFTQSTQAKNIIAEMKELEIIGNKAQMVDDEVQHEYEENYIEAESLEIKGIKPICKDSTSQYEKCNPKITREQKLSIINKKKEKKIEKCDAQCNTIIRTEEKGINAVENIKPKPQNIEISIRTVKRSLAKLEIPILKKLWLRKAFRTFRDNCRRPPYHLIIGREILRMAFLRWRFIMGYGPDRYGNVYDRDGNLLYKVKGKVADLEIQHEEIIEKNDEETQYVPIENIITTLKQIEFPPSYKKPVKKITKDVSVGSNIRLEEKIEKRENVKIIQKSKKKAKNYITKDNFGIINKPKKLKDAETQILQVNNKIQKQEKLCLTNEDYIQRKNDQLKLKELLTKMMYRKIIRDKLYLSEALRNWLKQTIKLIHQEEIENENLRRRQTKIKRNDRFSLIEKIYKQDTGTQMMVTKNQIDKTLNFNLIKNIKKKNAEINVDLPPQFDLEKIKPKKENKILFESSKKPVVLKPNKETDMNIYSADYIFREEVRRGIHHPMSEEAKIRVNEILYKFINSRGDPISILRKYFTIWSRKANYLTLIENAKIISEFCKRNLKNVMTDRKWKQLSKKILLKKKLYLVKLSKRITIKKSKIFDLIRITRINTVFSKRRFLHFIIIAWLAYTRTINQKRSHVQTLYENMLNTYMNIADDVFGSNQKENPSVQDALFEAVDSNKFQTRQFQDVPLAQEYYENKKEMTKFNSNLSFFYRDERNTNTINADNEKELETKDINVHKTIVNNTTFNSNTDETNKVINNTERTIEVKNEEILHPKGRGRAFRTNQEKEIIKKYNENLVYGKEINNKTNINKEKENNEENQENQDKVEEVRQFKNRIIIRPKKEE